MPQNFLFPQRDQPLLMPVDMREWLPEDDLVDVVLDAVATLNLGEFRRRYRADGHGQAAFDPEMMVALLLYGYCQGKRSSRVIEKWCLRNVAYRVIAGGLHPDHATIARFRARHEKALGGLFSQVLRLPACIRDEISEFFGDWALVEPGLTDIWASRPEDDTVTNTSGFIRSLGGDPKNRAGRIPGS